MNQLTYLQGYPEHLLTQVRDLIAGGKLGAVLEKRYPGTHDFATDKALWQYTQIRVATVFRNAPEAFLRMIVVHELAHLKEKDHDKAFYSLCCHMEPQYPQLEFDTRLWLTHLSLKSNAQ